MALRTFASRTFAGLTFAVVTLHGVGGGPITPTTITPVATLALPARVYTITIPARSYAITLVPKAPQLTLPARSFTITLPPRGQGGTVALSITKQPSETFLYTVFATQYLPVGRTIASVEVLASRKDSVSSDALGAATLVDATTILLANNPGKGARITIDPTGPKAELVKASQVSGSNPCTVTVVPALLFDHAQGDTVTYEPGYSASVLVSTAPTTTTTDFYPNVTRGIHGHTYRMSYLITLDNGNVLESESDLICSDT